MRDGKTLEVSTFRAAGEGTSNIFGTLAEDAMRRDFSLNALFYCPLKEQLIDYVDGYDHIRARVLKILAPPRVSFREDPVRILRAIKYATPHEFAIPWRLRWSIRRHARLLLECSRERLTEEFFKIADSGSSRLIVEQARRYGLMRILWPAIPDPGGDWTDHPLSRRLAQLDSRIDAGQPVTRGEAVAVFYKGVVDATPHDNTISAIQDILKSCAAPLVLSNRDSREAARALHVPPPKRRPKKRRRHRKRRSASRPHDRPEENPGGANPDGAQRSVAMRLNSESTLAP
jgi:poly(A) polymerase